MAQFEEKSTTDGVVRLTKDMLTSLVQAKVSFGSAIEEIKRIKTLVSTVETALSNSYHPLYARMACDCTLHICERTILVIDDMIRKNDMRHHELYAAVYQIKLLASNAGTLATEVSQWCGRLGPAEGNELDEDTKLIILEINTIADTAHDYITSATKQILALLETVDAAWEQNA